VLLNATRFGRHVCAVGANERVARYAAIDVDRVRLWTYVIAGLTVGISAILLSSRLNSLSSTNFGKDYELDSIAAVIIGGTPMTGGRGSIWGTIVGAIILGIINNMLNMLGVSPYLQGTVKGIVIIAAVLVQRKL
jgi:ribose transport system permease protein